MTYLRLRSWHILAVVEAAGWKTRCGFHVNEDAEVAYILPLGQKTCENCLRLTLKDEEQTDMPPATEGTPDEIPSTGGTPG